MFSQAIKASRKSFQNFPALVMTDHYIKHCYVLMYNVTVLICQAKSMKTIETKKLCTKFFVL